MEGATRDILNLDLRAFRLVHGITFQKAYKELDGSWSLFWNDEIDKTKTIAKMENAFFDFLWVSFSFFEQNLF